MAKKQTPVTMEMFDEEILPRVGEIFDGKLKKYEVKIIEFKEEVLGEIQKLRDEVLITSHHYEKTNERVDIIDQHLGINTSVVF